MKYTIRLCYLFIDLFFCVAPVLSQEKKKANAALTDFSTIEQYQNVITPSLLATHLYYLASDEMQGRETGSAGQKLAAKYLAAQYRLLGIQPKGTIKNTNAFSDSSFFQPFNLFRITPKKSSMEVLMNGQQVVSENFSAEHSNDLFYFDGGNARDASAAVVFAGYGIAADSLGYNDLKSLRDNNISITDKWVMILDDEPLADEKISLLPTHNHQRSPWAGGFFHKRLALWNAGRPKGILIVTDLVPGHKGAFAKEAAVLHKMRYSPGSYLHSILPLVADLLYFFKDGK
jgi:hypothetical protein